MARPLVVLAASLAAVGAVILVSRSKLARLVPSAPGSGGDPRRLSAADLRDGWAPRLVEVRRPALYAMIGCGRRFYASRPIDGRISSGPTVGGRTVWVPPGRYAAVGLTLVQDTRQCSRPTGSRGWWGPVDGAYRARNGGEPLAGVTDCEYLATRDDLRGPAGTAQVRAVTLGAEVYTLSTDSQHWRDLGVQGGQLYVSTSGYLAVDSRGRDLRDPVITYKGQPVPAAAWPGAAGPWRAVADSAREGWTAMIAKGDRHGGSGPLRGLVAPWDMVGPVYVWALLQRPRILVGSVKGK